MQRASRQRRHTGFFSQSEIKRAVDHMPVNAVAEGAAKPHIAHHLLPDRVGEVEVWKNRDLACRPVLPQQRAVVAAIRLTLFKDRDIGEIEATCLQIRFTRVGLCGDQTACGDRHFDHINIGQLHPARVNAVVIWIAHKQLPGPARSRGIDPRLQGRLLGIVEFAHIVALVVQRRPAFDARFGDGLVERLGAGESLVELP